MNENLEVLPQPSVLDFTEPSLSTYILVAPALVQCINRGHRRRHINDS